MRRFEISFIVALLATHCLATCPPASAQSSVGPAKTAETRTGQAQSGNNYSITLISQGEIIGSLQLRTGDALTISSDATRMVQSSAMRTTTLSGNVTIRVMHGTQQVLSVSVDQAIIRNQRNRKSETSPSNPL